MLPRSAFRLAVLAALSTGAAHSQTPAVAKTAASSPAPEAAAAAPVNDEAAQDRIMALVRGGKCGAAKSEATRVGDLSLADQIGVMCGARSADPFAKPGSSKGGGSGGGGGGYGSGRGGRGGGGG